MSGKSGVHVCVRACARARVRLLVAFSRESGGADTMARDECEAVWMRLAKVWQGHSWCGPEKFPHGSKMSAALLIDVLIRARCLTSTPRSVSPRPCTECVYTCLLQVAFGINCGLQNQIGHCCRTKLASTVWFQSASSRAQLKHPPDLIGVGL